jgi:hypothetical protein
MIMKIDRKTFTTEYGFIDYHYSIDPEYPKGILIFLGSFVNKEHRGNGRFKEMVLSLFHKFPAGTEVHVALATRYLVNFFERMDFNRVKSIEYWGNPDNTINLKGVLK